MTEHQQEEKEELHVGEEEAHCRKESGARSLKEVGARCRVGKAAHPGSGRTAWSVAAYPLWLRTAAAVLAAAAMSVSALSAVSAAVAVAAVGGLSVAAGAAKAAASKLAWRSSVPVLRRRWV
jgi:hypothetical protein